MILRSNIKKKRLKVKAKKLRTCKVRLAAKPHSCSPKSEMATMYELFLAHKIKLTDIVPEEPVSDLQRYLL